MNRAAHKDFLGVTVGEEICTDLDYADDVSLLQEEDSEIGLEINWSKTKLKFLTTPQLLLPRYLYSTMTLRLSTPLSTLDPA